MASIRYFSIVMGIAFALLTYLFGPLVTPLVHGAVVSTCNEMTGGNFRSYQVDWVVSIAPHWECRDRSDPEAGPVDMGWWVGGG